MKKLSLLIIMLMSTMLIPNEASLATASEVGQYKKKSSKRRSTRQTQIQKHDAIDLGLNVMWATCNVGAKSPEDYGDYFAWGEIKTKREYELDNCSSYGVLDNPDIGGYKHLDVARSRWGGTWRLPSLSDMQELIKKCDWTWSLRNGVTGYEIKSKINGNSIFLPATGYRRSIINEDQMKAYYWTSTSTEKDTYKSYCLNFDRDIFYHCSTLDRAYGLTVRPVYSKNPEKEAKEKAAREKIAEKKAAEKAAIETVSLTKSTETEAVDLGLSVKWASCNIGAIIPEGYGAYFAYGETKPKTVYEYGNYKFEHVAMKDISGSPVYDAARINWGEEWRIPTRSEMYELIIKCKWEETTQKGVKGYKVTGTTGNSIFLPYAGSCIATPILVSGVRVIIGVPLPAWVPIMMLAI